MYAKNNTPSMKTSTKAMVIDHAGRPISILCNESLLSELSITVYPFVNFRSSVARTLRADRVFRYCIPRSSLRSPSWPTPKADRGCPSDKIVPHIQQIVILVDRLLQKPRTPPLAARFQLPNPLWLPPRRQSLDAPASPPRSDCRVRQGWWQASS